MPSRKSKPTKNTVRKIVPKKSAASAKVIHKGKKKGAVKTKAVKAGKATKVVKEKKTAASTAVRPVKSVASTKPAVTAIVDAPPTMRERKTAVRKEIRVSLQKMRERNRRSVEICDAIISHPTWRRSTIVAIFAPMEHEPDVELLWKHADGKTLCYPTIRQGGLDFIGVAGPESVIIGQFGFREPVFDQARVIPPDTFDLVLVPGAAFTANGDRLGRGGGFYDRLLSSAGFRAFKVGVCFDRQVLGEVPVEAHDQRVHRVVTESGWLQRPDFVKKIAPRRSEEAKEG